MSATGFDATVRSAEGRAVIDLRGQIDGGAKDALGAVYERSIEGDANDVLLNFADVEYINSTGIALIVGLLGRARAEGRTLAACGLSEHYREIFEITRLADFIAIYPDEASASAEDEKEPT
jgi:anti-sigma B factor antagonist